MLLIDPDSSPQNVTVRKMFSLRPDRNDPGLIIFDLGKTTFTSILKALTYGSNH